MYQGVVKRFDPGRGFGFLSSDDGARDLFFHVSSVLNSASPRVEQRVSFDIGTSRDGRQCAERIRLT
jgi:CspA family cold shock protein